MNFIEVVSEECEKYIDEVFDAHTIDNQTPYQNPNINTGSCLVTMEREEFHFGPISGIIVESLNMLFYTIIETE